MLIMIRLTLSDGDRLETSDSDVSYSNEAERAD